MLGGSRGRLFSLLSLGEEGGGGGGGGGGGKMEEEEGGRATLCMTIPTSVCRFVLCHIRGCLCGRALSW